MGRRQIAMLVALAVACIVAATALLVLREPDGDTDVVASDDSTTTTAGADDDGRGGGGDDTTSTAPGADDDLSTPSTAAATADRQPATRSTSGSSPGPTAPAPPPPTTSAPPPPTTAPPPPFQSSIEGVTAAQLGSSWREGCPVGPDRLRALNLSHWGYDGAIRTGRLIVHADHAQRIVAVFRDIYAARFPIQRMVPVDAYGGDDQASMRDNNTSGFNCRYVAGTSSWSEHAYGLAVDVNPLVNPYVKGSTVDPPEGAPYADRSRNDPGMIHDDDAVVRAFAAQGWRWGGYWSSGKDYQHFSASGR